MSNSGKIHIGLMNFIAFIGGVYVCICRGEYGGQNAAFWSQFSPMNMGVLGTGLGLSGLAAVALTC